MSAITDLRGLAGRLEGALRTAAAHPANAAALERARSLATLALELSGGSSETATGTPPASWEQDTMTEAELTLAFVLGSIERAIRQPERAAHLLRDAIPRMEQVRIHLERARSS